MNNYQRSIEFCRMGILACATNIRAFILVGCVTRVLTLYPLARKTSCRFCVYIFGKFAKNHQSQQPSDALKKFERGY